MAIDGKLARQVIALNPWLADRLERAPGFLGFGGDRFNFKGDIAAPFEDDALRAARAAETRARLDAGRAAWIEWTRAMLQIRPYEPGPALAIWELAATVDILWSETLESDLLGLAFPHDLRLTGLDCEEHASLDALFVTGALRVTDCVFKRDATWTSLTVDGVCAFDQVRFQARTDFSAAMFHGPARFRGLVCEREIFFRGASFEAEAGFSGAQFLGELGMHRMRFGGMADFTEARFRDTVSFQSSHFEAGADFSGAKFDARVHLDGMTGAEPLNGALSGDTDKPAVAKTSDADRVIPFDKARKKNRPDRSGAA